MPRPVIVTSAILGFFSALLVWGLFPQYFTTSSLNYSLGLALAIGGAALGENLYTRKTGVAKFKALGMWAITLFIGFALFIFLLSLVVRIPGFTAPEFLFAQTFLALLAGARIGLSDRKVKYYALTSLVVVPVALASWHVYYSFQTPDGLLGYTQIRLKMEKEPITFKSLAQIRKTAEYTERGIKSFAAYFAPLSLSLKYAKDPVVCEAIGKKLRKSPDVFTPSVALNALESETSRDCSFQLLGHMPPTTHSEWLSFIQGPKLEVFPPPAQAAILQRINWAQLSSEVVLPLAESNHHELKIFAFAEMKRRKENGEPWVTYLLRELKNPENPEAGLILVAIGDAGPAAEKAVPLLIDRLHFPTEEHRFTCGNDRQFVQIDPVEYALVGIGKPALGALENCLRNARPEARVKLEHLMSLIKEGKRLPSTYDPDKGASLYGQGC